MWTFVGSRKNEVWIWLALEVNSRKVIGYAVGDCSITTFKRLWDGISNKIKHSAIFYTDR
jgi:IS1 family transposase